MGTVMFAAPITAPDCVEARLTEHEIHDRVQMALCQPQSMRKIRQRRREQRHPYPYPVHLTPLDAQSEPLVDQTIAVVGRHLSSSGLDFYSRQPIEHRKVVASLASGDHCWVGLLLDLTWCRFSRHGWYENGGRFLRAIASPLGCEAAAETR